MPFKTSTTNYMVAVLSAAIFFSCGYYILATGHPSEDAYILFIYAENLAQTGIINYFTDGPRAEGATDFLWMVAIAALNFIGFSSGLAALMLNTVGIFAISLIIYNEAERHGGHVILNALLALAVPVYTVSQSAYGGFSTGLYAAMVLILFVAMLRPRAEARHWIPLLAITIGLFRPDGVVIGVVATLIALFYTTKQYRAKYLVFSAIAAVIGVTYFVWRWQYFGNLLPLPLYVKSDSNEALPGLYDNWLWFDKNMVLAVLGICSIYFMKGARLRYVLAALPAIALLGALSFAVQSQNIAFRFQAPAAVILLFGLAITLVHMSRSAQSKHIAVKAGLLVVMLAIGFKYYDKYYTLTRGNVDHLVNKDYIKVFPLLLNDHVKPGMSVALTEAGRFAYWMDGPMYDLVGLNTVETAREDATHEYLAGIDPDLIFMHVSGTIDYTCPGVVNFCAVSEASFDTIVEQSPTPSMTALNSRAVRIPLVVYDYLRSSGVSYQVYFAHFAEDDRFSHIYAVKTDGLLAKEDFEATLAASFLPSNRLSYFDMLKRRARSAHQ